jgi:hypothetical protein
MDDKPGTELKYNKDNETLNEFYARKDNKSRIPLILDLLEHHWIEEPNLPFGRLLAKIHHNYSNDYVYRVSDEDLLCNLEHYGEMGNE